LEDPGVDGRIKLKHIFKKLDGGMDWIDLVQYGPGEGLMSVLNLRVP